MYWLYAAMIIQDNLGIIKTNKRVQCICYRELQHRDRDGVNQFIKIQNTKIKTK
jgi:hypothetical protein